MQNPLCEIANKTGMEGDFTERYYPFFVQIRESATSVLEIGVKGGSSLRTWKEFFPNAEIHGIDIDQNCLQEVEKRITVWIGDQADGEFLKSVTPIAAPFDLIIDDGSHKIEDQTFSFKHLFPSLKAGGLYVIEDTASSYAAGNVIVGSPMELATDMLNSAQLRGGSIRGRREDAIIVARARDILYAEREKRERRLTEFDEQIFSVYVSTNLIIVQKANTPTEEEYQIAVERLFPDGVK